MSSGAGAGSNAGAENASQQRGGGGKSGNSNSNSPNSFIAEYLRTHPGFTFDETSKKIIRETPLRVTLPRSPTLPGPFFVAKFNAQPPAFTTSAGAKDAKTGGATNQKPMKGWSVVTPSDQPKATYTFPPKLVLALRGTEEYAGTQERAGVAGSLALAASGAAKAANPNSYGGVTLGAGSSYYLFVASPNAEDGFTAIPSSAWYRFNRLRNVPQISLEEAEKKMNDKRVGALQDLARRAPRSMRAVAEQNAKDAARTTGYLDEAADDEVMGDDEDYVGLNPNLGAANIGQPFGGSRRATGGMEDWEHEGGMDDDEEAGDALEIKSLAEREEENAGVGIKKVIKGEDNDDDDEEDEDEDEEEKREKQRKADDAAEGAEGEEPQDEGEDDVNEEEYRDPDDAADQLPFISLKKSAAAAEEPAVAAGAGAKRKRDETTPPEAKKSRVAGEDGQQEEGADEWVAEIAAIMRQEGAIPLSEVNRESLIWAPYHADMPRFKAALKIVCRSETRDGVRYIMVKENVLD